MDGAPPEDVRNLGGRILVGLAAMLCGVAGAVGAVVVADWLVRHPSPHTGGLGTGQAGFFAFGSIIFGFIIGGAIGGITIEAIRRRMRHRRHHPALPRMVVVRRPA